MVMVSNVNYNFTVDGRLNEHGGVVRVVLQVVVLLEKRVHCKGGSLCSTFANTSKGLRKGCERFFVLATRGVGRGAKSSFKAVFERSTKGYLSLSYLSRRRESEFCSLKSRLNCLKLSVRLERVSLVRGRARCTVERLEGSFYRGEGLCHDVKVLNKVFITIFF